MLSDSVVRPSMQSSSETGVKIDIEDEGNVSICGTEKEMHGESCEATSRSIVTDFEAGQVLEGKVVSIKEFGAFVEFAPGKEGMVHISKTFQAESRQGRRRC